MATCTSDTSPQLHTEVRRLVWLSAANLAAMSGLAIAVILLLLPRLERAVATAERVEKRLYEFADDVQPVLATGVDKSVEVIQRMDAERLAETATESSDDAIRGLGQRALRYLKKDEEQTPAAK